MMALVLEQMKKPKDSRALVVAPDKSTLMILRNCGVKSVVTADVQPERFRWLDPDVRFIDLADVDRDSWPSDAFDLIVHSHVIEHIPATMAYPLYELFRMQKDTGKQAAIIPIMSGSYDEDLGEVSVEDRQRRFGQADHVRRIGRDDLSETLGKIVKLSPVDFGAEFSEKALVQANIPRELWTGWNPSTVQVFSKNDYLLSLN